MKRSQLTNQFQKSGKTFPIIKNFINERIMFGKDCAPLMNKATDGCVRKRFLQGTNGNAVS
jgi:hypothetical protein